MLQGKLHLFALGDILAGAFVVEHFAPGIAHHPHIHNSPDFAAVFAVNLIFEAAHLALGFQPALELQPALRPHAQLLPNVRDAFHQFPGR